MTSANHAVNSIESLTQKISNLSKQVSEYLTVSSHPTPTFDASSAATPETEEYEALRAPLNDAALDLLRLINGPKRTVQAQFLSHYDLAALQIALDRDFFRQVPLQDLETDGNNSSAPSATVKDIAANAGMDEDRTARTFRLLATQRIFERVPGASESYSHTAISALFARDGDLHDLYDFQ
jgi:hypothetical protein